MRNVVRGLSSLLACAVGLGLGVVTIPDRAIATDDPPAFAVSAATGYQVTFAARVCPDFAHVMVGRVRDDHIEAPVSPGRDNLYADGALIDPEVEQRAAVGCDPLTGWRFTLGAGYEKRGPLSTVTGMLDEKGPTVTDVPLLDSSGQPTQSALTGAVTVSLTEEQIDLATHRQLWAQGGRPTEPLLGDSSLTFGALRCAADGRSGANVQWLGFPSGVRHVFCFAYYVRNAVQTATIVMRARTTRPVGYQQKFTFAASFGYTTSQSFSLTTSGEAAEATFVRSVAEGPYDVSSAPPTGWRLARLDCDATKPGGGAVGTAATDRATGRAFLRLAAAETMTCVYVFEPPSVSQPLSIRLYSEGGGSDTFGADVVGETGSWMLQATTPGDGGSVPMTGADLSVLLPGTYVVTVNRLSGRGGGGWRLRAATCAGRSITPRGGRVAVTVPEGTAVECVLRVSRPVGGLQLSMVTSRRVGTGAFTVAPVDGDGAGLAAIATTVGAGTVARATGEGLESLGAGSYLVTPLAPRTTSDGGWRLTAFDCGQAQADRYSVMSPDSDGVRPPGPIVVTLRPGGASATCEATWGFVPATRLQIALRFTGGAGTLRERASVIEVSCEDGASGRVVLPSHEDAIGKGFAIPLSFLSATECVITHTASGVASDVPVVTTISLDPSPIEIPLALPLTLPIQRDVEAYTLSVVEGIPVEEPSSSRPDPLAGTLDALPFVLAGAGLLGCGILALLIVAARVRRPDDDVDEVCEVHDVSEYDTSAETIEMRVIDVGADPGADPGGGICGDGAGCETAGPARSADADPWEGREEDTDQEGGSLGRGGSTQETDHPADE